MMPMQKLLILSLLLIPFTACSPQKAPVSSINTPGPETSAGGFTLTSERFNQGQPIPEKYTCKGQNVSPALAWSKPPKGVKTFALVLDDPDAPGGTWTHWVLYNIPAGTGSLPDALPGQGGIAYIGNHGMNSSGNTYYAGPCPPSGMHRYFFKLYALDASLDFSASPDAAELTAAMQGHILGQAELMGTYSK
jgi:hypothetical protein